MRVRRETDDVTTRVNESRGITCFGVVLGRRFSGLKFNYDLYSDCLFGEWSTLSENKIGKKGCQIYVVLYPFSNDPEYSTLAIECKIEHKVLEYCV